MPTAATVPAVVPSSGTQHEAGPENHRDDEQDAREGHDEGSKSEDTAAPPEVLPPRKIEITGLGRYRLMPNHC